MPQSSVAIGTYDTEKYLAIGSPEAQQQLLQASKNKEYDSFKMEDKNFAWIEQARK